MEKYTDDNYTVGGYVEGDEEATPTPCDTSLIEQLISQNRELIEQNKEANRQIKELLLAQNNKIVDLDTKIDESLTQINARMTGVISTNTQARETVEGSLDTNLEAFKSYVDDKIPFVDDKGLSVYPKGTKVGVQDLYGMYTVESSCFVANSTTDFTVMYTLSEEQEDGSVKMSSFPASRVFKVNPEQYLTKEYVEEYYVTKESVKAECLHIDDVNELYILKTDCSSYSDG